MNFFKLQKWFIEQKHKIYTFLVRRSFGAIGKGCIVQSRMRCWNPKDIFLGERVFIGADAWIDCFAEYFGGQKFSPRLEIGDDTMVGYHSHIMVVGHMKIGKNVLIADKVYISDNLHCYEDVSKPIISQPVIFKKAVSIGDGSWIGENVSIIGASIGKQCVIGSNSVVTKDIPDYSIAVGSPAKVIKKYDFKTKSWLKFD